MTDTLPLKLNTLAHLSLQQAAALLRAGQVTSVELTRACLKQIEALDSRLHAFLAVTPEQAYSAARAADEQLAAWHRDRTQPLPPLTGIPLAV